jgi:hypothetical protein
LDFFAYFAAFPLRTSRSTAFALGPNQKDSNRKVREENAAKCAKRFKLVNLPNQMIDMIIAIRDHEGVRLVGEDPKT